MSQIIIIEKQKPFRDLLTKLIHDKTDIRVQASFEEKKEALRYLHAHKGEIQLLLMGENIAGREESYLTFGKYFQECFPDLRVIFLAFQRLGSQIYKFYQQGIAGYLFLDSSFDEYINAMRKVLEGGSYYQQEVKTLMEQYRSLLDLDRVPSLSPHEQTVLVGITEGLTNREIGKKVGLGEKAVAAYWENIRARFATEKPHSILRKARAWSESGY